MVQTKRSAAFDADTLLGLRAGLGEEKLAMLLEGFIESLDGRVADMRAAFADSRDADLRCRAHALKGCAATYGAHRLAAVCSQLEGEGASPRAPALLERVSGELRALREADDWRPRQSA